MPEPGIPRPLARAKPTLRLRHEYTIKDSAYEHMAPLDRPAFDAFGAQADDVYSLYDVLIDWLKTPYIPDDCANHDERVAWLKTMDDKQQEEMRRNKLALNTIIPIFYGFGLLTRLLAKAGVDSAVWPSELAADYKADLAQLTNDSLPNEKRIAITQKWERNAKQVVDFLESYTQGAERTAVA